MILVVGGAFQGKGKAAQRLLEAAEGEKSILHVDAGTLGLTEAEPMVSVVLEHVERFVKQELDGKRLDESTEIQLNGEQKRALEAEVFETVWACLSERIKEGETLAFTMDEMGCGVVPMTYRERAYREIVGRIGCRLAEEADEVYRVVCGIAVKIK